MRTAGGATVGTIRSGMSRPRDPDEPSLLTTLPVELRLQIYEYLFLQDKPIVVQKDSKWVDNATTEALECECLYGMSDEDLYPQWVEDESETSDSEDSIQVPEEPSSTAGGINAGFGLLGSCRQIYTEAIDVLYSKNAFTLPLESCCLFIRVETTVQWMLTLGSNIPRLRRVYIQASEADFGNAPDVCEMDILSLVGFMGQNPTTELRVLFGPDTTVSKTLFEGDNRCKYSQRLNGILSALVKDDALDIMKYMVSKKLVSAILINQDEDEESGCIYHPYTPGREKFSRRFFPEDYSESIVLAQCGIFRNFDYFNEGCTVSWRKARNPLTLSALPESIQRKIVKYAIFSEDGTSFDLNLRKSSGFQPGVFGINHRYRVFVRSQWSLVNAITLKMTTNQHDTNFSEFSALRHWIGEPLSHVLTRNGLEKGYKQQRIILQFRLDGPSDLSMLRIKLLRFVQFTLGLDHQFQVVFALGHSTHDVENIESHTITLKQLRQNFFVLLSKACDTNDSDLDMPCPDIEFNGRGMPVQLCYPGGTPQSGQLCHVVDPYINKKELKDCASRCSNRSYSNRDMSRRHTQSPEQVKLREMWLELKYAIGYR